MMGVLHPVPADRAGLSMQTTVHQYAIRGMNFFRTDVREVEVDVRREPGPRGRVVPVP